MVTLIFNPIKELNGTHYPQCPLGRKDTARGYNKYIMKPKTFQATDKLLFWEVDIMRRIYLTFFSILLHMYSLIFPSESQPLLSVDALPDA